MSIIVSASNKLKFHHWPTGETAQTYTPVKYEEGHIKSISWSKDGFWILLVPSSGPPELISIKNDTIKLLQKVEAISHPTHAVFQNTTKRTIAVSTLPGQILIYDIKTKSVKKHLPRVASTITQLQYNAKDTHLAVSCAIGEILLYNSTSSKICSSFRIPKSESVPIFNFHRTKRSLLCAGNEDGHAAVWDINTNKLIFDVQAHQAPVTALAFSVVRADMLVTGGLDRRFAFYDTLAKKAILEVEVSSSITALDFSICGKYLGLGSQAGGITLYDTRKLNAPLTTFPAHDGRIRHLLFQKKLLAKDEENDSAFDVGADEVKLYQPEQEDGEDMDLGMLVCGDVSLHGGDKSCRKSSTDSFLGALGFESGGQDSSSGKFEGRTSGKVEGLKKRLSVSWLGSKGAGGTPPGVGTKRSSSTPKFPDRDLATISISPLVGSNSEHFATANMSPMVNSAKEKTIIPIENVSAGELKAMMKEVAKEELEVYTNCVKNEFAEVSCQMRQQFLDVQMSIARAFVDLNIQNNKMLKELVDLKEQIMYDNILEQF